MEDTNVTPFPKEKTEKKDNSLVSSLSPREIVSESNRPRGVDVRTNDNPAFPCGQLLEAHSI